MATCPHCQRPIEPPPKRSRKCPHCRGPVVVRRGKLLTEAQAAEWDERAERERAAARSREAAARFREGRRQVARELREAKRSGVVAALKPLVSEGACAVCLAARGKVFPVETCTPEMLPPYEDCEFEGGCESSVVEVLKPAYAPGTPPRRGVVAALLWWLRG